MQLRWVLKRHKRFKKLPLAKQRRYLTELIAWRYMVGRHDGLYMAFLLPGIHHFELCHPADESVPSTQRNWFV
ncbi:hypothetical protein F4781DRAFT_386643 [Annulohypoxylon bovei var. microspora]|nr:hypothetical protein F4781DRAFT_386643 [Annulohypoxylon bovei var. microspora]